jgi:hypothetical protein
MKCRFAKLACLLIAGAAFSLPASALAQETPAPSPSPAPLFVPANQLQPARLPGVIAKVFRRLAHDRSVQIAFNESRQFSISKQPVRQSGVLRSARDHGLSMEYQGAKPRVLIIDDLGLIERQPNGHERQINIADHPEVANITDLYLNLLRGNSAKLFDYADAYFAGTPQDWRLGLVPKDPTLAKRAGRVVITGSGRDIRTIDSESPNGDLRTLELGKPERNPKYTPDMLKLYFRA